MPGGDHTWVPYHKITQRGSLFVIMPEHLVLTHLDQHNKTYDMERKKKPQATGISQLSDFRPLPSQLPPGNAVISPIPFYNPDKRF
jgi:hypothetical protein